MRRHAELARLPGQQPSSPHRHAVSPTSRHTNSFYPRREPSPIRLSTKARTGAGQQTPARHTSHPFIDRAGLLSRRATTKTRILERNLESGSSQHHRRPPCHQPSHQRAGFPFAAATKGCRALRKPGLVHEPGATTIRETQRARETRERDPNRAPRTRCRENPIPSHEPHASQRRRLMSVAWRRQELTQV
jgi:hypothetical protein